MSLELFARSPDLRRLREEGYDIEIRCGHILLKSVPYLARDGTVKYGTLISEMTLSGDATTIPSTHVCLFSGEYPCSANGTEIDQIRHQSGRQTLCDGLTYDHSFSSKPDGSYRDYYEKMTTYAAILSSPAATVLPSVTVRVFPTVEAGEGESVFKYLDTATSRAEIGAAVSKLKLDNVAIIGIGGTGSYILDLVAKTPVRHIHLFDGDEFANHNAFRAPGAPSIEELRAKPLKVDYFTSIYSRMHRGIVGHGFVTDENVESLSEMDFVFVAVDRVSARSKIIASLRRLGVPYIDVGMGIELVDEKLLGVVRTTTNEGAFTEGPANDAVIEADDLYSRNVQIADLNALNAALAVIRWKKRCGFYHDHEVEAASLYTIDGNHMANDSKGGSSE